MKDINPRNKRNRARVARKCARVAHFLGFGELLF
jgi:hypothetical protein